MSPTFLPTFPTPGCPPECNMPRRMLHRGHSLTKSQLIVPESYRKYYPVFSKERGVGRMPENKKNKSSWPFPAGCVNKFSGGF